VLKEGISRDKRRPRAAAEEEAVADVGIGMCSSGGSCIFSLFANLLEQKEIVYNARLLVVEEAGWVKMVGGNNRGSRFRNRDSFGVRNIMKRCELTLPLSC
jgi:hypothetical protein